MAALRVCRAVDNHRELRRAGAGGAPAVRRQNGARPAAGKHRKILSVHLLRGGVAEDPGAGAGAAQKLLPQEHMEYYGLFRCYHRVSAERNWMLYAFDYMFGFMFSLHTSEHEAYLAIWQQRR